MSNSQPVPTAPPILIATAPPSIVDVATLSPREQQVLHLVAQGKSNKEAAKVMGLSVLTVSQYATRLYHKLAVTNRAGATAWLLRSRIGAQV